MSDPVARVEARPTRKIADRIEQIFSLDLRSLALFRISIAALLFGDLAFRLPHLVPLYAERGLLASENAMEIIGPGLYLSLHFLLRGSDIALGGLFAFQLAVSLAMLVGYRTRVATAISWYLLASLHVVEVYHLHMGGDTYLRMMLLWGALLPLGRVWSLDARRQQRSGALPQGEPGRAYSLVTFALVSQFLIFYLAAGLNKNTPMWVDGDAVYYMLHRDHLATMFTPMLLEQRWALSPLTYGTYWFEVLGPLLLVFPFFTSLVRAAALTMFVCFHIGLALFLDIGPYPLMSIAPLAALIPTRFWREWWPRLRGRPTNLTSDRPAVTVGAPRVVQVFAGLVVVYAVLYQMQEANLLRLPRPLVAAASAVRINQSYRMMRVIGKRNFWLIVDGRTADGSAIDPFQRRPVSIEKPADIPASLRSFRWSQFILGSVAQVAGDDARLRRLHHSFAEYLCLEWNAEHFGAEKLERLQTVRGFETTSLEGVSPPEYIVLWQHECGAPLASVGERSAT